MGIKKVFEQLKAYAKRLKRELFVLYLAYKDSRVPWYAKVFSICVVAYAFSPIDLIPDFIFFGAGRPLPQGMNRPS